jgi:ERO1-like protein beta
MNTLFRFSESLASIEQFRKMWRELDQDESERIALETEKNTASHVSPLHRQEL